MSNTLNIARKEFQDLINSKIVLLVLGLFFIIIMVNLYDTISYDYSGVNKNLFDKYDVFEQSLTLTLYVLANYGMFVGVFIGFSCIADERRNNALNVLMTKPLYRDTIINGKILGAFYFLICVFGFIILLYTSCFLLLYGMVLGPHIADYLARVGLVFVLSVISSLIYVSVALLIALIVKNMALSLILSMMTIIISGYIRTIACAKYIGLIANGLFGTNPDYIGSMIVCLSPGGIIGIIMNNRVFGLSYSLDDLLSFVSIYLFVLAVYLIIPTALSYIIFVRSDIK